MERYQPLASASVGKPTPAIVQAILKLLYTRPTEIEEFVGCAIAITPRVVLTAGHHFSASTDDVGRFKVRSRGSLPFEAVGEYAAKHAALDLLVVWVDKDLPCWVPVRGYLPPVGSRVSTVWLNPHNPDELMTSPGEVVLSDPKLCKVRGSITVSGSSGAPVVDCFGDHIVGIHLSINTVEGSRMSEFVSMRKVIEILPEMEVNPRLEIAEWIGKQNSEKIKEE